MSQSVMILRYVYGQTVCIDSVPMGRAGGFRQRFTSTHPWAGLEEQNRVVISDRCQYRFPRQLGTDGCTVNRPGSQVSTFCLADNDAVLWIAWGFRARKARTTEGFYASPRADR
jgi:hypothetical protein